MPPQSQSSFPGLSPTEILLALDGLQQLWGAVQSGITQAGCIADFALVHSSQAGPGLAVTNLGD